MPIYRRIAAVVITLNAIVVAGCGSSTPAPIEYQANGLVIEGPRSNGPQLCLGVISAIFPPPVCDGFDVAGWDWKIAEGEESASGLTWGRYSVVGTLDGDTFTLTRPPRRPAVTGSTPASSPRAPSLTTACPAPISGWKVGDQDGVPEGIPSGLERSLRRNPDVSAVWIDPNGGDGILNVRYARNTARHTPALRRAYPGNLCVTTGGRRRDELQAQLTRLMRDVPRSNRSSGWVDEIGGHVYIEVVVDRRGELQSSADRRAGPGVVTILPLLRPL